jgi:hypothetical protein
MANLDPNVKRRNWIVLIILIAAVAAIYGSFIYKTGSPG